MFFNKRISPNKSKIGHRPEFCILKKQESGGILITLLKRKKRGARAARAKCEQIALFEKTIPSV